MKPSHTSCRHARISGMNTLIVVVIVVAIFASIYHAKKRQEQKHIEQMMTDTSRLMP